MASGPDRVLSWIAMLSLCCTQRVLKRFRLQLEPEHSAASTTLWETVTRTR